MTYEYRHLIFDFEDLGALNRMGGSGWRVVYAYPLDNAQFVALMERSTGEPQ